jgi:chromosome segregation ATPase
MRTLTEIHAEIDRLSERRTELYRELSYGHDAAVRAEIKSLDEELNGLWAKHRELKARLRFGERDRIIARARQEERLERAA